jgi:hypothetical protein
MEKPMQKHLIAGAQSLTLALAAILPGALSNAALSRPVGPSCADKDNATLLMLQQAETSHSMTAKESLQVAAAMSRAQMLCYEGRAYEAAALYDDLLRRFGPEPSNVFWRHR